VLIYYRMKNVLRVLAALVLSTVVFAAPTLQAQPLLLAQQGEARLLAQASISQRRALELVREKYSGSVISITQVSRRGGSFYRVRMDDNGNIFTLYVNAISGEITRE
jgi:uncharacterized membrane protein YkoI